MNKEIKSAWYNKDILCSEMIRGALGLNGWARLEHSGHFKYLDTLVQKIHIKTLLDLGCGAAELGRVYQNKYEYTGFDLEHIIENVAKTVNPQLKYGYFYAYNSDFSFLKNNDLIVCNSFLSEMDTPVEILIKILNNIDRYFIIHRQIFSNEPTNTVKYGTYGNLETSRSIINFKDFENITKEFNLIYKIDMPEDLGSSILLERKK